jgi:hypothetical protein
MVLPIWLWLVTIIIILVTAGVMRLRKTLVTDPQSRRAVASGQAITDAKLENHCRSAVMQHELTAPGQTRFVAFFAPLQFTERNGNVRVRTPISLALSERTLAVSYKQGALGNVATALINRTDIKAGYASGEPSGFPYTIETSHPRSFVILLQSEADRNQLASWVGVNLTDRR